MGILTAWLGEYHLQATSSAAESLIPSRVINVSDLKQVQHELEATCARVEIMRPEHGRLIPLAESIEDASSNALGAVVVAGFRQEADGSPIISLQAGKRQTAHMLVNMHVLRDSMGTSTPESVIQEEIQKTHEVANRAWQVITTAGRRTLGVKQICDLATAITWVVLAAVLIWFARAVWPIVPAVVVALLSLTLVGHTLTRAIRNYVTTRAGHGMPDRLIVQPITREEWRRQRYQSKRDWKVGVLTGVITLVATAVATFLATVAAFNELPGWWPF